MRTEDLTFYHGTGAAQARGILSSGARESLFAEIGAYDLGKKIRLALLEAAGLRPNDSLIFAIATFERLPCMEHAALWALALERLASSSSGGSLIDYGAFFATLNIGNAYRYAICNPYRSEFIRVLAESLRVLEAIQHDLAKELEHRYPEVYSLIKKPSAPVVIELCGIARSRLKTEWGEDDVERHLDDTRFLGNPTVSVPAAFRISAVTTSDIVAIHSIESIDEAEVEDDFWFPDAETLSRVRAPVPSWLRQCTAQ